MNEPVQVESMKYHAPGWKVVHEERLYQVWGPGEVTHDGTPTGRFRDNWSAAYSGKLVVDTDFLSGEGLQDVLRIFPLPVQKMFQEAIGV